MNMSNLPKKPADIAAWFGNFIKAGMELTFWIVLAAFTLGAAYVALRAIWYAVKLVLKAIGV